MFRPTPKRRGNSECTGSCFSPLSSFSPTWGSLGSLSSFWLTLAGHLPPRRENGKVKMENGHPLPPTFFVSAHSKGVTDVIFVSADPKGVMGGQLRPKPGKTRCFRISAHSKGDRERLNVARLNVLTSRNARESGIRPAPGVLSKGCGND